MFSRVAEIKVDMPDGRVTNWYKALLIPFTNDFHEHFAEKDIRYLKVDQLGNPEPASIQSFNNGFIAFPLRCAHVNGFDDPLNFIY